MAFLQTFGIVAEPLADEEKAAGAVLLSQSDLVQVIMGEISRQLKERGVPDTGVPRQFNAVIDAANLICHEWRKSPRRVTPGMGYHAWRCCDEVGRSSEYMGAHLTGLGTYYEKEPCCPGDSGDFGRCVGLLIAEPELREKLHLLSDPKHGPGWNAVVKHWADLEKLWNGKHIEALDVVMRGLVPRDPGEFTDEKLKAMEAIHEQLDALQAKCADRGPTPEETAEWDRLVAQLKEVAPPAVLQMVEDTLNKQKAS